MVFLSSLFALALLFPCLVLAQTPAEDLHAHHMHHDGHDMDADGMVMNENTDKLPQDCPSLSGEQTITVHAGRKYATAFNGTMFSFDRQEWNVPPCSKVVVTLINDDQVRHQWMVHGLPRYLYVEGMFHLEANGGRQKTGIFIVPSAKKTYLVHCDIAQHMEKGMKAQLKVGGGNGDLPSIPGVTGPRQADLYPAPWSLTELGGFVLAGVVGAVLIRKGFRRA
ncbi:MAG: copper oxidase [Deltaproteobacteria bacterium]|nr:copper oxidase [Deltaproteobacteria bacterium]